MSNLSGRAPYQKAEKIANGTKDGRVHMARVRSLPCCICHEFDMRQNSPTEAHHVKSGRYGNAKESDFRTIPLCHSHHNRLRPYPGDGDKIGYHNGQATWEEHYGPDTEWLSWTEHQLGLDN